MISSATRSAIPASRTSPFPRAPLLLASASPRRAQILETLGVPFRVVKSSFEEPAPTENDHQNPARYVETLAQEKARAVDFHSENIDENALILSADTIVWHNGKVLGKPRDENDAVSMLQRLRNEEHQVLTGVCLRFSGKSGIEYSMAHEITKVRFRDVSDSWIRTYVATGEPLDKAGSYGAQGKGALLVERIDGDFWNVVGLPLAPLRELLKIAGASIEEFWEVAEIR